jgi:UV DNA damage repair endonuclease
MSPELGLVCITVSKDVRYRTVTRTRLLEQSDAGQRKVLDDIYRDNLQTLARALQYCKREGIRLYRMPLTMPAAYARAPWIEIEAKSKEEAIAGLRGWLQ